MVIRRRRFHGELAVEQTADLEPVQALLIGAGVDGTRILGLARCWLIARIGDDPAGAAGLETSIDAAFLVAMVVAKSREGQGVGGALMAAARKAAHTRGARRLYALAPLQSAGYLRRFGFVDIHLSEMREVFDSAPAIARLLKRLDEVQTVPLTLDLASDGIVLR